MSGPRHAQASARTHSEQVVDLWPGPTPAVVRAGALVLREWRYGDAEVMVDLFDTDEMDRRTPLASPFDLAAARRYVAAAHRARREVGALQLAITVGGGPPLGEVLAVRVPPGSGVELAYAVGAAHTGRGLARTALLAVLRLAGEAGLTSAQLRIADDNEPSRRVAAATGFVRTDEPLAERRRKGRVLRLATWRRTLPVD